MTQRLSLAEARALVLEIFNICTLKPAEKICSEQNRAPFEVLKLTKSRTSTSTTMRTIYEFRNLDLTTVIAKAGWMAVSREPG